MRSKIPRRAVKALQSDRARRAPRRVSGGKIVAHPVRAFMTNMFDLRKTANIDSAALIQVMALILSCGVGWRFTR
jgi:hypothetical protein